MNYPFQKKAIPSGLTGKKLAKYKSRVKIAACRFKSPDPWREKLPAIYPESEKHLFYFVSLRKYLAKYNMKKISLGNSELNVSTICLGTMTFGQQNTEEDAHQQLSYAVERGVNFIDTAEMYPVPARAETCHRTEQYIGTWLEQQPRDQLVIATKAAGPGRGMKWIREGRLAFTRENLREALESSLKRLRTDYVDLYQLHWPDRNTPVFGQYHFKPENERDTVPLLETISALAELVTEGKIRHWGMSNETPWGLMTALRLADENGFPRPVSVQNAYNLINRSWESGLSEIGYRENIALLAYSPLGFGLLSGKYLQDPKVQGRVNIFPQFGARYSKPNTRKAVAAYAELAGENNLTPTQLALGYLYQRWCVASTIIGATTMQQLQQNLDVADVKLGKEVLEEVENLHLVYTNPAP